MGTSKAQLDAMNLYAALMDEARMRIQTTEFAISGLLNFHPVIIREFSYLQMRILCEMIALGCLVAHGDIAGAKSKTLSKAWQADEIFAGLERLHPDFYPQPVKQVVLPTYHRLDPIADGFMTKAELLDFYRKSGDVLHRGNLRKLLKGPISAPQNYPDVREWLTKTKLLLDLHRIGLLGGNDHFICFLSAQVAGGKAQVAHAEAALPPEGLFGPDDQTNPTT